MVTYFLRVKINMYFGQSFLNYLFLDDMLNQNTSIKNNLQVVMNKMNDDNDATINIFTIMKKKVILKNSIFFFIEFNIIHIFF